ncbi:PASTA domain-containing protein [Bacteroidales bacterium OttesenSCG-928-K03]|nr:PASTA domain-containing protein [Odoribacter sp. OttesenSCG-928-L07]MDL2239526.1 PASTA domain-containing protein [Bacteroidales bacterium OttesenSCG-928-L14]MDL2242211.1 PASTA domain-containing protein [Bacteroidales bacterium OttesenSCG-928-K03]
MQRFLKLISNVYFWLQFVIAIALIFIVLFIIKGSLKKYTRHDKELVVPVIENMYYDDLVNSSYGELFSFTISDSTYNALYEPGIIISQNPVAGSKVKPGRKIYLTVSAESPGDVQMPNLINLSVRQAISIVESSGLKFGSMEFVPSFDKDAVLQQKCRDVQIEPGTLVVKGSVIDIVVGAGYDRPITHLPFILGKNANEAKNILRSMSLNIGEEHFHDSYDIKEVFVYGTEPIWTDTTMVNLGEYINLFYTADTTLIRISIEDALIEKDTIFDEYYFDEEINFDD